MAKGVVKYRIFNSKLTSVVSISMVLFLLGIVSVVLLVGNRMSDYVRENYTVTVVLRDSASARDISVAEEIINGQSYVKNVNYISKEEALEELTEELGENPIDFIGYNPLYASFEVKIQSDYTEVDSLENIKTQLEELSAVRSVSYQKQMIDEVNANINRISVIFLALASVLLFISFVLINNTIGLLIHSDRFLINTMKLVGATRGFIRRPYLVKGVKIGIVAAVLSIMYLAVLSYILYDNLRLLIDFSDPMLYTFVGSIVVFAGIFITLVSSYLSVNKFLSKREADLYYI